MKFSAVLILREINFEKTLHNMQCYVLISRKFLVVETIKTQFFQKEKFFRLWLTTNDFFHEVNWHLKNAGKFN